MPNQVNTANAENATTVSTMPALFRRSQTTDLVVRYCPIDFRLEQDRPVHHVASNAK